MPYSVFVIVALAIHILINIDMFIKKDNIVAIKSYRLFLISIALFYVTDILWGIFDDNKMRTAIYVDTTIYFVMMGLTIFFWTNFVIKYLEGNKILSNTLKVVGILFLAAEIVLLIVNIPTNILFDVNEKAEYQAYVARDIMLWAQIIMYSLLTIYSFIYTFKVKTNNYRRYIAISLFSMVMIACIAIQLGDPLIPFYSIGCLVGVCILDTYALSETKERFKDALEEASKDYEKSKARLGEALSLAYSDPLTGVKSKHAYVEVEAEIDELVAQDKINDFAVLVFDLNGLKQINDTQGHSQGDKYIIESAKLIAEYFPFDSIYRFGGDEFVVILRDDDFVKRQKAHNEFMKRVDINEHSEGPVISSGMSKYRRGVDNTFRAVFYRADKMMYGRKEYLKEHKNDL